jgi:hypothetical protein
MENGQEDWQRGKVAERGSGIERKSEERAEITARMGKETEREWGIVGAALPYTTQTAEESAKESHDSGGRPDRPRRGVGRP